MALSIAKKDEIKNISFMLSVILTATIKKVREKNNIWKNKPSSAQESWYSLRRTMAEIIRINVDKR
jgi:hypothetical protein